MKNETTTNDFINEILSEANETIKNCIFELRMSKNSIVKHNTIMQVGAMTVHNKNGFAAVGSTRNPSRFCADGVKEISKINFTNGNGDTLKAQAVSYKDWYRNELKKALDVRYQMRSALIKNNNLL